MEILPSIKLILVSRRARKDTRSCGDAMDRSARRWAVALAESRCRQGRRAEEPDEGNLHVRFWEGREALLQGRILWPSSLSKERSNGEYKACLKEKASRLLDQFGRWVACRAVGYGKRLMSGLDSVIPAPAGIQYAVGCDWTPAHSTTLRAGSAQRLCCESSDISVFFRTHTEGSRKIARGPRATDFPPRAPNLRLCPNAFSLAPN